MAVKRTARHPDPDHTLRASSASAPTSSSEQETLISAASRHEQKRRKRIKPTPISPEPVSLPDSAPLSLPATHPHHRNISSSPSSSSSLSSPLSPTLPFHRSHRPNHASKVQALNRALTWTGIRLVKVASGDRHVQSIDDSDVQGWVEYKFVRGQRGVAGVVEVGNALEWAMMSVEGTGKKELGVWRMVMDSVYGGAEGEGGGVGMKLDDRGGDGGADEDKEVDGVGGA
ncbi:uncharacterized protein HMPREF1541_00683 [Cyphellophora europaea CBS 101466]|uniref:Uncharacterized protein n=1 Tax=Cyphellophora europaea (strain CBS 101466) TaxID=1220924 RepID=W2SEP6_CYPE1|nr:uncharacterized protein HMPREF1541_00683 [Cyphellophora europaea CBS 101466]ETN46498.1 hypothetical protein HMPREF1541_00683 [Cyphellophora europaea CBS 101466]